MVSTTIFGFKGLPHISEKYEGDKYLSSRYKIKKAFEKLGDIKKLYIDMNTGSGRVTIENITNQDNVKIVTAICNSPMRMIKFSWEQPILEMKSDKEWLLPYKAWLFLDVDGSYTEIKQRCQKKLDFEQMIHTLEYEKYLDDTELEDEMNEWELQCQMDEILTSCHLDFEEDEIKKSRKRSYDTMIVDFDSEDESDDEYELVESFTPVSGKTDFTIEEICEHIRVLAITKGTNDLSVKQLTEYFGQKREFKKVSKSDLDTMFPKLSLN